MAKTKRMAEGGAAPVPTGPDMSPRAVLNRSFNASIQPVQKARTAVLQNPASTRSEIAEAQAAYRAAADPMYAAWRPQAAALKAAETLASRHARPTQGRASMMPQKMAKGGKIAASKRADGIAQRGKTRGKMV